MITKDGLRWKKCFLQDDNLIIDGESYSIESLKEIINLKILLLLITVILAIGFILMAILFYLIKTLSNPKILNEVWWNIIPYLFIPLFTAMLLLVIELLYNSIKYRSCWAINYYHILWIEKDDIPGIEARLRTIERKLPIINHIRHIPTRVVILSISGLVAMASSLMFAKINNRLMLLSIICGLLLILIAALLHGMDAWNKSKWKK